MILVDCTPVPGGLVPKPASARQPETTARSTQVRHRLAPLHTPRALNPQDVCEGDTRHDTEVPHIRKQIRGRWQGWDGGAGYLDGLTNGPWVHP